MNPTSHNHSRNVPMSLASSPMRSIRMWRAPSSAAFTSATPFSALTNFAGHGFRRLRRVVQQCVGQRLQAGLARDHRLGTALGLVGR